MPLSITKVNNQPSFGSRNNPIKGFRLNTSKGQLNVKEFKIIDCMSEKTVNDVSTFFIDNFIDGSTNPAWKSYKKPENKIPYLTEIENFKNFLKNIFTKDDGNTTVLIARDKDKKIKGGLITLGFDEIRGAEDLKTCYVDAIAVDKDFRHNNVAKTLLEKSVEASTSAFSDVLLMAYNKAVPFYKKIGYEILDTKTPETKAVFELIKKDRNDVPKYTKLMTKPINPDSSRWWQRIYRNRIKKD